MQGFRLYEINFDAIESEIYRTDLQMWEAYRKEDNKNYCYFFGRLERLKVVKEWYKQRIIKFINTL